jgi:hypothetical protein
MIRTFGKVPVLKSKHFTSCHVAKYFVDFYQLVANTSEFKILCLMVSLWRDIYDHNGFCSSSAKWHPPLPQFKMEPLPSLYDMNNPQDYHHICIQHLIFWCWTLLLGSFTREIGGIFCQYGTGSYRETLGDKTPPGFKDGWLDVEENGRWYKLMFLRNRLHLAHEIISGR